VSLTGDLPKKWTEHLSSAELWCNTKFHTATKMSPFEALYSYLPSMPNVAMQGDPLVEAVAYTLKTREQIANILQVNLHKAQRRMKTYAVLKQVDEEFQCGHLGYFKIQPDKQMTLANT